MTALMLGVVPQWHERALCRQVDPELFYPEKGSGVSAVRQAKRICDRCEVKPQCGAYAIEHAETYGVWGGTSETERRRIRGLARAREARLLREAEGEPC